MEYFLLLVGQDWGDALGAVTTKEERDLSFLLAGNGAEATVPDALSIFVSNAKILALRSCKLWSTLQTKRRS